MKRKLIAAFLLMAGAMVAQTTTVTATIKDRTGALVTSGSVTFEQVPAVIQTSGTSIFVPLKVTCLINGSGNLTNMSGGSCVIQYSTALQPYGTFYRTCYRPYNALTACMNFYAYTSTQDISSVVLTPATAPAYSFVDLITTQTISGAKTFTGANIFSNTNTFSSTVNLNGTTNFAGTQTFTNLIASTSTTLNGTATINANTTVNGSFTVPVETITTQSNYANSASFNGSTWTGSTLAFPTIQGCCASAVGSPQGVNIFGGNATGASNAQGGSLYFQGGTAFSGGFGAGGNGGDIHITGGTAFQSGSLGGTIYIKGGSSNGNNDDGAVFITGGQNLNGGVNGIGGVVLNGQSASNPQPIRFRSNGVDRLVVNYVGNITPFHNVTVANGANVDIVLAGTTNRLVGATGAFSVSGFKNVNDSFGQFTEPQDGQELEIFNTVAFQMTIKNEDAGETTATRRITTLTGADVVLRAGTSYASLRYDGTNQRWILRSTN